MPLPMLVDGFIDGEVGGVEEAEEGALLYPSWRHQVLEPDSMRACGQGEVSAKEERSEFVNPEYHHSLWWGCFLSLPRLPKGHFKACSPNFPKESTWGQPLVNPHDLIFLCRSPPPSENRAKIHISRFCAQSKS